RDLAGQPSLPALHPARGIESRARAILPGGGRKPDLDLRRPAPCVRRPYLLLVEPEPLLEPPVVRAGAASRAPGARCAQALVRAVRARLPEPARGRGLCAAAPRRDAQAPLQREPAIHPAGHVPDLVERDHGGDVHRAAPPVRRRLREAHREAVTGYSAQRPQALQDFAAIGSVRTTRPPHSRHRVGRVRTKTWMVAPRDLRDRSSWRPSSAGTCMLSLPILLSRS